MNMKKKLMNRVLSLIMVPCLLTGPVSPAGSASRWVLSTSENTAPVYMEQLSADTDEKLPTDPSGATDPTGEDVPQELAIAAVQREHEDWASSVVYSITITGDLTQLSSVALTAADNQPLTLEKVADDCYLATITSNGTYTVTVTRVEGEPLVVEFTEEKIDGNAPNLRQMSTPSDGWYKTEEYVFEVSDDLSGIDSVTVQSQEGAAVELTPDEGGICRYTVSSNATHTVTALDMAGNTSSITFTPTNIDSNAPEISEPVRVSDGWAQEAVYEFTVADPASGVASVTVQTLTGEDIALTVSEEGVYSFAVTNNEAYTITVVDMVGNQSQFSFSDDNIDCAAPVISDVQRETEGWMQAASYAFTVTDNGSGVASVIIQTPNSETFTLTADADGFYRHTVFGNGEYHIIVSDRLGNTATKSFVVSQIDVTGPQIMEVIRENDEWGQSSTYQISITDDLSGVLQVFLRAEDGQNILLTPDADGMYCCTVYTNGSYEVIAEDLAGNTVSYVFEENRIDVTPPEISELSRQDNAWQQETVCSFTILEQASGVASVTVCTNNGEPVVLTADADGVYHFAVTGNDTYTVSVTDNSGNTASACYTESYIDQTAPDISEIIRQTVGWAQEAVHTFTVEDLDSGVATVVVEAANGAETVLTPDSGGIYHCTVSANGEYVIKVTDAVGNVSSRSFTEVATDTTIPELSAIVRQADGWAQEAIYVFTASDDLSGISHVFLRAEGGEELELAADSNGLYFCTIRANGSYCVTVTDMAGNTCQVSFDEKRIDRTVPQISEILRAESGWTQETVCTFTTTDDASGIKKVTLRINSGEEVILTANSNDEYSFAVSVNGVYVITVTDIAGNEARHAVTENYIDRIQPNIYNITPQQTWDSRSNTVSLSVDDDCELASVIIAGPDGTVCPFEQLGSEISLTVETNGTYTVTATDVAGNVATAKFTVDHIDTEIPSTPELSAPGTGIWVNTAITINAASADSQSGVKEYWDSTDSGVYGEGTWNKMTVSDGIGTLRLTEDQDTVYYVAAIDGVGRVSTVSAIPVKIDRTPAETVSVAFVCEADAGYLRHVNDKPLFLDQITFQAAASDSASGVVRYEYRVKGASGSDSGWISVAGNESGFTQTLRGEEDLYTISVRVYDDAGNCTSEFSTPVCVLENTHGTDSQQDPAPSVSAITAAGTYTGAWTKETIFLSVYGSESISGIERYEYRIDYADPDVQDVQWTNLSETDGDASLTISSDTNAIYSFRAVSYAGNTSLVVTQCVKVQKTAPQAATLVADKATGTNSWYTVLPGYDVILPVRNQHLAPVSYTISCVCDGQVVGEVVFDGSNAPQITRDGSWTFRITVTDAAGNQATADYSAASFNVDTKAPTELEITMNGDSVLNCREDGELDWNNVNILDRIAHSDFTIIQATNASILASADGGNSGLTAIYYQITAAAEDYDTAGQWTLLDEDGLVLTPDSKNHLYFKAIDGAGNVTYFSGKSIILDHTAPATDVSFGTVNLSALGFYNGDVTVNIHVEDPAVEADRVFAGLVSIRYRVLRDDVQTQQGQLWPGTGAATEEQGRIQSWDGLLVVEGLLNDSNTVTLELTVTDAAGNTTVYTSQAGEICIDTTFPAVTGRYDRNQPVSRFQNVDCFTGSRTLFLTVEELNFVQTSSFIRVTNTDTGDELAYSWISNGSLHTSEIPITEDGHYIVTASITDAAGNVTEQILYAEGTNAPDAFIIDNTPSRVQVTYDNQDVRNGVFFDAPRTVTITVNERNFDAERFAATVWFTAEDGTEQAFSLTDWRSSGNIHTATMTCDVDGIYRVTVEGEDALGNAAEATTYIGQASDRWVLDTYMNEPVVDYIVDGVAYNGALVPQISVLDANVDTITVKLMRTRLNEIAVDVTDLLLTSDKLVYQDVEGGKTLGLDIFPLEDEMDGRYTLLVECSDKAGNTAAKTVMFYVNRFGSVYTYSDYLTSLMDGYFKEITEDIIITEYNPSGVIEDSSRVQITVDGVPLADPVFTIGSDNGGAGVSGWFEYTYTISRENFTKDGVYDLVISSRDTAGNVPENTDEDLAIRFAVDTTAPVLPSIVGLEDSIVKADSIQVKLSAMDNVRLSSITVYLNGEVLEQWTDIADYSFDGTFAIPAGLEHKVRLVVTDMTGNTLDTDNASFEPGYGFNRTITVSSNFFLRFYANRPLFYGSIIALSLLMTGSVALLVVLPKKKKQKENTDN